MLLKERILDPLLYILYPASCMVCDSKTDRDHPLCINCLSHLPYISDTGLPAGHPASQRLRGRFQYRQAYATFFLSGSGIISELVHRFKYKYDKAALLYVSGLMCADIKNHISLDAIDAIVPVPIHKKKIRSRGYNQSVIIAGEIGRMSGIPVLADHLIKSIHTPSQTQMTRAERLENVRHSFSLKDQGALKHKHILLVDDILTTGATLEACAALLIETEGVSVSVATLALADF